MEEKSNENIEPNRKTLKKSKSLPQIHHHHSRNPSFKSLAHLGIQIEDQLKVVPITIDPQFKGDIPKVPYSFKTRNLMPTKWETSYSGH